MSLKISTSSARILFHKINDLLVRLRLKGVGLLTEWDKQVKTRSQRI